MQGSNPPPSSRQPKLTPFSASENSKAALELYEGSGGALVIAGAGGGVPSTLTTGCEPWSPKAVASLDRLVVHSKVPSAAGAMVPAVMVSVAPGQSSLAGSGGATASIRDAGASSVTVQVAAVQLPAEEVAPVSEVGSTTNPGGTVT